MWHQIDSFLRQYGLVVVILSALAWLGHMAYIALRQKKENKKWRPVPIIKWNAQGMATITDIAITATPVDQHHVEAVGKFFPSELSGFIANLTPGEISTILLEVSTHANMLADDKKKDVLRAVTISAARYGFLIPIPLVCLDARTHALYLLLSNTLDMCKVSKELIVYDNQNEPTENYLRVFAIVGHILMHYAAKGPYPSVGNFIKTVNRNLKGSAGVSDESVLALATAYAGLTNMPLPHAYHRYLDLTAAVYYSTRVPKIMEQEKPKLTLVK